MPLPSMSPRAPGVVLVHSSAGGRAATRTSTARWIAALEELAAGDDVIAAAEEPSHGQMSPLPISSKRAGLPISKAGTDKGVLRRH